ncbi:hypothetical protein LXL04_033913 [Taraxacum kok-saghyz]
MLENGLLVLDLFDYGRGYQISIRSEARGYWIPIFLTDHILSVDVEGNIFIWAFKGAHENPSPIGHILLDNEFTPSCIMHPDTYLNKVILELEVKMVHFNSGISTQRRNSMNSKGGNRQFAVIFLPNN